MRLYVAGQKAFGAAVYDMVRKRGHEIVGVSSPAMNGQGEVSDRLRTAAERDDVRWLEAGRLNVDTMPEGVDLIVAAHSHDFIGRKTRNKTALGAIGYHPSLLPRHKGRDAIRWTIHMGDAVTGGSVYWLSENMDGGDIAAARHVFVEPGETPEDLWRRKLMPLGVELIGAVLDDLSVGRIVRRPQDPAYATWEPSWDRPPAFRPDLDMIGALPMGYSVVRDDIQ